EQQLSPARPRFVLEPAGRLRGRRGRWARPVRGPQLGAGRARRRHPRRLRRAGVHRTADRAARARQPVPLRAPARGGVAELPHLRGRAVGRLGGAGVRGDRDHHARRAGALLPRRRGDGHRRRGERARVPLPGDGPTGEL
ncbi:MAG: hypothetical protein AVDCRST_MAG66-824, partial [uncultured Pseudonocardia sp.]